jgi:SAM-dependent methyltransferase
MSDPVLHDPTGRFTGLADRYACSRPDYPPEALDLIVARGALNDTTLLVDVGCGTGISSRLVAARGIPVVGVEPNDDMRARAEAAGGAGSVHYQKGTAEATGLPDAVAVCVLSAQAFHWFDAPRALAEFRRILRPGGWVALIWNERDEADLFTAAYGAVIRTAPDAARLEGARMRAGQALLDSALFEAGEKVVFGHAQVVDEEGLVGRALSASYAPREPAEAAARFQRGIRDVFARFESGGRVSLRYQTTVYLARRSS